MRVCQIDGCGKPHFCKGFCRIHFERWKRHGDPLKVLKPLSARGAPSAWLKKHAEHAGDECLIWPFARFPDGRAHMNGAKPTRVMCELAHGPAPSSIHEAAHSCGRGHNACIHPGHLRWATPVENAADKEDHGTVIRGVHHYNSKLTEDSVREIRQLASTMKQAEIAMRFGVKLMCVNKIINRKSWKHVA